LRVFNYIFEFVFIFNWIFLKLTVEVMGVAVRLVQNNV